MAASIQRQSSSNTLGSSGPKLVKQPSFSLEKTVVDGIEFTAAAPQHKFGFKRTNTVALQDEISEDSLSTKSEDDIPEGKHRNFEFTNNVSVMRVLRAFLFFQIVALICDNPDVDFPPVFNVLCRSPFFYTIRFYSRPFVDVVYIIQTFLNTVIEFVLKYMPSIPSEPPEINYDMPFRRILGYESYLDGYDIEVDFKKARNWHAIIHFSHYFMGAAFFIMSFFLTLQMWQIKDYTDRFESRKWLKDYIADGWYRRGGVRIIMSMLKLCCCVIMVLAAMYAISQQKDYDIPDPAIFGAILGICASATIVIFLLSVIFIKSAESAFVQYVSQNVNYTSTIILKRVIKSKVELSICLVIILYMPVLYTWLQSLMMITDWNDALVMTHRRQYNYNTPCYYEAFPPFTIDKSKWQCPNRQYIASYERVREKSFYDDVNILPCDSILGTCFYTLSCIGVPLFMTVFAWFIYRIVNLGYTELTGSRWFDAVSNVCGKYTFEKKSYENDFHWKDRLLLSIRIELKNQYGYLEEILYYTLYAVVSFVVNLIQLCFVPLVIVKAPISYFGKRALLLCCNIESDVVRTKKAKSMSTSERITYVVDFVASSVQAFKVFLNTHRKRAMKAFLKSTFVKHFRVLMYKFKRFITCAGPVYSRPSERNKTSKDLMNTSGLKLVSGEWREDLKMTSRERALRKLNQKLNNELTMAKIEFVSDHVLTISIGDYVVDTSAMLLLVCSYRWTRMWFSLLLPIELTVYVFVAALSNFYFTWQTRALIIVGVNIIMIFLTYTIQPYADVQDRWVDWVGRLMVVFIGSTLVLYDQSAPPQPEDDETNRGYQELVETIIQVVRTLMRSPAKTGRYLVLDVSMVLFVYLYALNILRILGVFRMLDRKINKIRFAMHDYIVDFLVKKVDDRAFGVENVHISLPLIQQWDDVIKDQRRYGLLPKPDVRPPGLLSIREKYIEVKWAALFNLNLSNMRTSLGLSLLHIVMCSADPEITRWLIHVHPHLLAEEDFQRDTPISIALKEAAYYLLLYSNINDGMMDDGTSYADDEFYTSFPEILEMRENVKYNGEYVPDAMESYQLSANERDFFLEHGYFVDRDEAAVGTFRPQRVGENSSVSSGMVSSTTTPSKSVGTNKKSIERKPSIGSIGANVVHVKRYPEDNFYDDFEGGQAAGWVLLGMDVSENNIDNEQYGSDSDFDSDEDDLRYGIMESAEVADISKQTVVPPGHRTLKDSMTKNSGDHLTGFELILRKKQVKDMSRRDAVGSTSAIMNDPDGLPDEELYDEKMNDKEESKTTIATKTQEIMWRLCKYADIFLSDQVFVHCYNMGWDTIAYKELNKMSSKLQGLAAQHLAVCFNLNPPPGFTRLSDWSAGLVENIQEEYSAYDTLDEDQRPKSAILKTKVGETLLQSVKVVQKGVSNFSKILSRKKSDPLGGDVFNDRIVQYLAECYAASRDEADMDDSELGIPARIAWRAISRAFRKKTCTFIVPGIFTPPKPITLLKLSLQRNELDCGDAVMLADIIINQQTLIYVNASHNRIGCRGMNRLCQSMKGHKSIRTFRIDYNRIGPYSGKFIGSWIKQSRTLQVISMSHNRLGALIRYPSIYIREMIPSAGRYIFFGLKSNKTIMSLDVSYNDLGPNIADIIPAAIKRHPCLYSLNIAGNNIGTEKGGPMIWALGGRPGGQKRRGGSSRGGSSNPSNSYYGSSFYGSSRRGGSRRGAGKSTVETSDNGTVTTGAANKKRRSCLAELCLADNQLGEATGAALGNLIKRSRTLTALDISKNCLGINGGKQLAQCLGDAFGYNARILEKKLIEEEKILKKKRRERKREEHRLKKRQEGYSILDDGMSDYDGSETTVSEAGEFPEHWKQRIVLCHLDVSRNNLGPINIQLIMEAVGMPNCTLTSLDISDNPVGVSFERAGTAITAANSIRSGLLHNRSLKKLNVSNIFLLPPQVLPILGGITNSRSIIELKMNGMMFDEPCCLQLANAIGACETLQKLMIRDALMGPKGGGLVAINIERVMHQLRVLDLTGSKIGFYAMDPIMAALSLESCSVETLLLGRNELDEEGGLRLVRAIKNNKTLTELDLSENFLTYAVAHKLADATKQYVIAGEVVTGCKLKKIILNDNPDFGHRGSRLLLNALASEWTEHVEMANCGVSASAAHEVSKFFRVVTVAWKHLDLSRNYISRVGMNQMFWALRQNRRIRVLRLGDNKCGLKFGTSTDTLGHYGVGLLRAVQENLVVRELDLSFCGLSSETGANLFSAMCNNFTIRVLRVRGNCFEDDCNVALETMLKENDIITELDIGDNKFGSNFAYSLADGIEENHAIQTLIADKNNLAIAGGSTLESFYQALILNNSLKRIVLDGNRMGSEWGVKIGEALTKNSTLRQVSLRNNRLDSRAGESLLKAYTHNNTLLELAVSSEEVGLACFEKIKKVFLSKRSVAHLSYVESETTYEPNLDNVRGKLYS